MAGILDPVRPGRRDTAPGIVDGTLARLIRTACFGPLWITGRGSADSRLQLRDLPTARTWLDGHA